MADDKPIIIVKKKGGHGGHHGGAWKVAYADFVTAMMCFFMVMWLINSAETVTRQNIASYFRKPGMFDSGSGTPLLIGGAGILDDAFAPATPEQKKFSSGAAQSTKKRKAGDEDVGLRNSAKVKGNEKGRGFIKSDETKTSGYNLEKAVGAPDIILHRKITEETAEFLKKEILNIPALDTLVGLVNVKLEGDGLIIEIMDTDKASMFASGSPRILPDAEDAFLKIASVISKVPNSLDVIGHTDGKPFGARNNGYSNWELSVDRANSARRVLIAGGLKPEQIGGVVGKADRELKTPDDPLAPSNRRITLKMKFDFKKIINYQENPEALDDLSNIEPDEEPNPDLPPPPPPNPARDVIVETKDKNQGNIQLPEEGEPRTMNPPPQESIITDSPVIGPSGTSSLMPNFFGQ